MCHQDGSEVLHRFYKIRPDGSNRDLLQLLQKTLYRLGDTTLGIPDIIFLDLNMPILSGFETLQQIREDVRFKDVPVIAIYSTSATTDGINNTFGLGANAYIIKPIAFSDLKKLLKKVIETDWQEKLKHAKIESYIITV